MNPNASTLVLNVLDLFVNKFEDEQMLNFPNERIISTNVHSADRIQLLYWLLLRGVEGF